MHNPFVTAVRTTTVEMRQLARALVDRVNRAEGPVAIVIPQRGFSEIDAVGRAFYEPETDNAFTKELRKKMRPEILLLEVDYNINDSQFAEAVVNTFDELVKGGSHEQTIQPGRN